ncbi:MAG: NAD(P)/FAD-dependent oxidoreductase, partial [Eubacteriales bacterium]|nr:NAD(P)/FAD-dependent oxidoreductase [Eubacteriales bacterium]
MSGYDFTRSYDAVVVGAGNGGLVSGVVLARSGLTTLVLEKHNIPGGFASSFVRGRFEFETALHVLADYGHEGDRGNLGRFFDEIGLDVAYMEVPEAYRLITTKDPEGNLDVVMPMGVEAYIDKMEEYVPGSRESVTKYIELSKEVYEAMQYLGKNKGNVDRKELLDKYGNFVRTCAYSQQQVLDALKMPKKAQRILNAYWTYLAVEMERINFTIFGVMIYALLEKSAFIPKLRSYEISMALDRKIKEYGGEIEYNTKVEQILVEDGRVVGVKTQQGEYIKTDFVIANASDHTVYANLIYPKSEVPKMGYQMCNARKMGPGGVVVYLGLNKSAEELGITEYEYLIYDSMNTKDCYDAFFTRSKTKAQATACINKVIPDCSPPGTCIISFTVLNDGYSWADVKPEDYFEEKTRIAQDIIDEFEAATGVNIKDSIEEIEIATPETFANFNCKYNGSIYGYEIEPWDSIIPKTMTIDDADENPIHGLRLVGGF